MSHWNVMFHSEFDEKTYQKIVAQYEKNYTNKNWLCRRVLLSPLKSLVNLVDAEILEIIPMITYTSIETLMENNDDILYLTRFWNS